MNKNDLFALLFTSWLAILMFFAMDTDISLYIILIFIGFLVLRELFDMSLTRNTKERLNFYLYVGVMFFSITVVQKVLEIIG
ncbi:MAG TPA: hypothetical protein PK718_04635 [Candidatus Methanofastidiosa archaeon]|nr:hypothetical protein [Candidatus Methanofastidiosa archaeon]